jgi:hypothetical protein
MSRATMDPKATLRMLFSTAEISDQDIGVRTGPLERRPAPAVACGDTVEAAAPSGT